jgi:hypothetical protein
MKLNCFKITGLRSNELAVVLLAFDAWLFKMAVDFTPDEKALARAKKKKRVDMPANEARVLLWLVDMELDDLRYNLPSWIWDKLTVTQVEGGPENGGAR